MELIAERSACWVVGDLFDLFFQPSTLVTSLATKQIIHLPTKFQASFWGVFFSSFSGSLCFCLWLVTVKAVAFTLLYASPFKHLFFLGYIIV